MGEEIIHRDCQLNF